jgi:hypothetical protein
VLKTITNWDLSQDDDDGAATGFGAPPAPLGPTREGVSLSSFLVAVVLGMACVYAGCVCCVLSGGAGLVHDGRWDDECCLAGIEGNKRL